MIEHEFQKDIDKFKIEQREWLFKEIELHGHARPTLSVLYKWFDGLYSMELPLPDDFMTSEYSKQLLTKTIIPGILEMFTKTKREVICVSFVTEAWMRTLAFDEKIKHRSDITRDMLDQAKKQTKRIEVVMQSFETELTCVQYTYVKTGTGVNKEGEATGKITLHEMPMPNNVEGRFTTLFRKIAPDKNSN